MQDSLIDEGLTLMLAGMGTVVVFLTVLVIAMSAMSGLIRRLQPVVADISQQEVAAIGAALKQHRQHK